MLCHAIVHIHVVALHSVGMHIITMKRKAVSRSTCFGVLKPVQQCTLLLHVRFVLHVTKSKPVA